MVGRKVVFDTIMKHLNSIEIDERFLCVCYLFLRYKNCERLRGSLLAEAGISVTQRRQIDMLLVHIGPHACG